MYAQKVSKNEQEKKGTIVYHIINTSNEKKKYKDDKTFKIVSIDPAVRNFCMRIERRPRTKYNNDGNKKITPLVFETTDFQGGEGTITNNYETLYNNLNGFLLKYRDHWLDSDFIIVERQLSFNTISTKVMQHVISFFMCDLRDSLYKPIIIDIDPKMKNKYLEMPRNLNKRGYKEETVKKVLEILEKRGELDSFEKLKKSKKKDDLADTVAQIEAMAAELKW